MRSFKMMYEGLAELVIENLDFHRRVSVILEAGCGSGKLTLPLLQRIRKVKRNFRYIAFDVSSGPYLGSLQALRRELRREGLDRFVGTVEGDVRDMQAIEDRSVDVVISNELFCDLDRRGLERALEEFYRILEPNGQMAHGELIPVPENEAQRLLIDANAYSLETMHPKPEWFSPYSDEVASLMHRTGFKNILVRYLETNVRLDSGMAMKRLKRWKTDPDFLRRRLSDIRRYGMEWPMEHVIFCHK